MFPVLHVKNPETGAFEYVQIPVIQGKDGVPGCVLSETPPENEEIVFYIAHEDGDGAFEDIDQIQQAYENLVEVTGQQATKISHLEEAVCKRIVPTSTAFDLKPNCYYVFGTVPSLVIGLKAPTDQTCLNEYRFRFTSGATATILSVPSSIRWVTPVEIEPNTIYEASIVDNLGVLVGVSND